MSTENQKLIAAIKRTFESYIDSIGRPSNVALRFTSVGSRRLDCDLVGSARSPHYKGLAVDYVIEPVWHMPLFVDFARAHPRLYGDKTNTFISLNGSLFIHSDWDFLPDNIAPYRREGVYLVEMPYDEKDKVFHLKRPEEVRDQLLAAYGARPASSVADVAAELSSVDTSKPIGCCVLLFFLPAFALLVYSAKIIIRMVF